MAQQCTAKAKSTRKRCTQPAVLGKDKCRIHGGLTPIKHGLYSKYTKGRLADLISETRDDPSLMEIREPLAMIVGLGRDLLRRKERLSTRDREALLKLAALQIDGTKKLVEVEKGILHVIRPETLQAFIQHVQEIQTSVLRDHPELLAELAARLATLEPGAPGAGPDVGAPGQPRPR